MVRRAIFFLLLFSTFACAEDLNRFHVCTISSYRHKNLEKLIHSCKKHHIELDVLGIEKPYPHNGIKFFYMEEYLKSLEEDDIVMYVDAFDVIIVADKEEILRKFLAMDAPFVMAAEMNCAPNSSLAPFFPHSPTPFKFINTGTYIGYVKNIREWIQALQPVNPNRCDQAQTIEHYLKDEENRRFFTLDYQCELFLPLFMVPYNHLFIDIEKKQVRCRLTKTTPCVIHANGSSFFMWDKIYKQLIVP